MDQASEIVKTNLKSPASFHQAGGEVLWEGKTADGEKAYVVSVKFDAANSFGASLRGCMYVAYAETKDKKITWNQNYGVNDYTNLAQLCEESTPMSIKQDMVNTLVKINFPNDGIKSNAKSDDPKSSIAYGSTSDSNEFSGAKLGEKIKLHKQSQLDIDGGPYFFTANKALISFNGIAASENEMLEKPISKISFNCQNNVFGKSTGKASIDDINCESTQEDLITSAWKRYCDVYSFRPFDFPLDIVYIKKNSYAEFHYDDKKNLSLSSVGKFSDKKAFLTGVRDCSEADDMKKNAQQQGFKSLGDFMIK